MSSSHPSSGNWQPSCHRHTIMRLPIIPRMQICPSEIEYHAIRRRFRDFHPWEEFVLYTYTYVHIYNTTGKLFLQSISALFEYAMVGDSRNVVRAVIVGLEVESRGRRVIHVKPVARRLPGSPEIRRPRPEGLRSASSLFTFYFHAVLTPIYATSLTCPRDIARRHVSRR